MTGEAGAGAGAAAGGNSGSNSGQQEARRTRRDSGGTWDETSLPFYITNQYVTGRVQSSSSVSGDPASREFMVTVLLDTTATHPARSITVPLDEVAPYKQFSWNVFSYRVGQYLLIEAPTHPGVFVPCQLMEINHQYSETPPPCCNRNNVTAVKEISVQFRENIIARVVVGDDGVIYQGQCVGGSVLVLEGALTRPTVLYALGEALDACV
jgi:hypothetical protein